MSEAIDSIKLYARSVQDALWQIQSNDQRLKLNKDKLTSEKLREAAAEYRKAIFKMMVDDSDLVPLKTASINFTELVEGIFGTERRSAPIRSEVGGAFADLFSSSKTIQTLI